MRQFIQTVKRTALIAAPAAFLFIEAAAWGNP